MSRFQYIKGMTMEEMTVKIKELIEYMKTDDYWIKYGSNYPIWSDGHELVKMYLKETDKLNKDRKDTLIVELNITKNKNCGPNIKDRTTTHKVKVVKMNGEE